MALTRFDGTMRTGEGSSRDWRGCERVSEKPAKFQTMLQHLYQDSLRAPECSSCFAKYLRASCFRPPHVAGGFRTAHA